ncbi:DUF4097 family beta strand repeat protein [bacterium]|nr:DUF4097 family beta strand repeat protein [candidate division CSSED10-310 bacterium]
MAEYRVEKRLPLDGVRSVIVINPIGRIEVEGWDESELLLQVEVKGENGTRVDESMVPVVDREKDQLIIRSIHPGKHLQHVNDVIASLKLHFDDSDEDDAETFIPDYVGQIINVATESSKQSEPGVTTSIFIRMPRNIDLTVKKLNGVILINQIHSTISAKGINGPITVTQARGQVLAKTVNGPLILEKSSPQEIQLKSVNGPVKCYLDDVCGPIQLKSVNGPIRIRLPETADVEVTAKTMHGVIKIASVFKQTVRSSKKVCGTLNSGKHPLLVKTLSGPVTISTTESEDEPAPPPPQQQHQHQQYQSADLSESEKPDSIINRMVKTGKISREEAEKLRRAL